MYSQLPFDYPPLSLSPVRGPDVSVEGVVEVDGVVLGGGGEAARLRVGRRHAREPREVVHRLPLTHRQARLPRLTLLHLKRRRITLDISLSAERCSISRTPMTSFFIS